MKGDKYKSKLIEIIDDTVIAIGKNDYEKAKYNLDSLSVEFNSMSPDAFMGSKSIFAIILYASYCALKIQFDKSCEEKYLLGLS
ncbi:MAG TPA: hypothetical protein VJG30_02270 [Candidatus Nanoarchaeia archaeon]|nr:hypothetical protein [Candidatus Nanoarchaeia archaeon]